MCASRACSSWMARIALQRLTKQLADAADERSPRAQATAPSTAAGALHAEPLVAKRSASQATGTAAAVLHPGVLARRGARTAAGSTGAAEAFSSANVPIDVATGGAGMEGGPPSQIWPASCEAQDSKVAGAKEALSSKAWPVQHAALKHAAEWPRAAGGAVMEKGATFRARRGFCCRGGKRGTFRARGGFCTPPIHG